MKAKEYARDLLCRAMQEEGLEWPEKASVEPPKEEEHGDVASNAALVLASSRGQKPRDLAGVLQRRITGNAYVDRVEIAGPGFLNFFFTPYFWHELLQDILDQGQRYGCSDFGRGERTLLEYVSANPTGPLHVGHGRGAAVGDSLARILQATGFVVDREYYVNDCGRQAQLLGQSILVRYRELFGEEVVLPEECYKGGYVLDLAEELKQQRGPEILQLPEKEAISQCADFGLKRLLEWIRADLSEFGVQHDIWFKESSLIQDNTVQQTLDSLKREGMIYEQNGALWFCSTEYGDDKDRVVRKSDGELTYFASDVAYHADKFSRGYDRLINIWGADHHGYIPRIRAAAQALGRDPDDLQVLLVQMVNLLRGGRYVSMSTRAGEFSTLREVVQEVGSDAARFIFLSHKSDSHLDFDLDLVQQRSMDNPVYYVQYAHARICSLFQKAYARGFDPDRPRARKISRLIEREELDILRLLDRYPQVLQVSARSLSPHHLSFYLRDLASALHSYYNKLPVLKEGDPDLSHARMALLSGIGQVLRNGLSLLGVRAPEQM